MLISEMQTLFRTLSSALRRSGFLIFFQPLLSACSRKPMNLRLNLRLSLSPNLNRFLIGLQIRFRTLCPSFLLLCR